MAYDISSLYAVIAEEAIMGTLVIHCSDGQCQYANRLAREILEVAPEAPCESITLDSLKPDRVREGFRAFSPELVELQGLIRDVMIKKADGMMFVADLGIKRIALGTEEFMLLMFQDVTIQKKLQREIQMKQQEIHSAYEELLEQNKQLKELDVAKDKFITLTTHELRTPISAIFATAEVLKNKFYDTDEQRDEFIDMIYDQAIHILDLVNDILDFAKIQAGKMDFFIEETCLRDCLDPVVNNCEVLAKQANLEFVYEPMEPPITTYYDNIRLGEVFTNVIGNAIKFTQEGTVTVSMAKSEDGKNVRVTVKDTGAGIPEDKMDKVFNEFETVGSINTHQKGTGLGMPISKKIMDTMGGSISFESTVGVGTTFYIDIPAEKVLDESNYQSRPEQVDDLLDTV